MMACNWRSLSLILSTSSFVHKLLAVGLSQGTGAQKTTYTINSHEQRRYGGPNKAECGRPGCFDRRCVATFHLKSGERERDHRRVNIFSKNAMQIKQVNRDQLRAIRKNMHEFFLQSEPPKLRKLEPAIHLDETLPKLQNAKKRPEKIW